MSMTICDKDIRVSGRFLKIASLHGEKHEFPQDPEAILESLRRSRCRVDLFTFLQKLPDVTPQYSYPIEWDNLAVLPVSTFDHWWNNQIRSYARNRSRQAAKRGVVIREVELGEELLKGICDIYNECPIRQGRRFPHYGMTLEQARGYAGTFPERSIFIGAYLDNRLIGFAKLTTDETRTQACLVHVLSLVEQKDKAPTNALIAQAVRSCAERGMSYLIYENFTYGKKQNDSLSHFKEVNGFERLDIPRYYIPITPLGKIAFRLGLHRRLVERLPESVASKYRDFRRTLYSWKFQASTEA